MPTASEYAMDILLIISSSSCIGNQGQTNEQLARHRSDTLIQSAVTTSFITLFSQN